MYGRDLLVTPVLEHGARERRAYLPSGADWADALDRCSNAEWCGDCCSDAPGNDPRSSQGRGTTSRHGAGRSMTWEELLTLTALSQSCRS